MKIPLGTGIVEVMIEKKNYCKKTIILNVHFEM